MTERPTWDEYFMKIAHLIAERSTCMRRKVGAIVVLNKRILATGYNGAPKGIIHCEQSGCLREQMKIPSGKRQELCRGLHAEQNALLQAASSSTNLAGGTLYSTIQPCVICAKMIINAELERVVYEGNYPDNFAVKMFEESGIELVKFERKNTATP
jgi:dCMP deaminase